MLGFFADTLNPEEITPPWPVDAGNFSWPGRRAASDRASKARYASVDYGASGPPSRPVERCILSQRYVVSALALDVALCFSLPAVGATPSPLADALGLAKESQQAVGAGKHAGDTSDPASRDRRQRGLHHARKSGWERDHRQHRGHGLAIRPPSTAVHYYGR